MPEPPKSAQIRQWVERLEGEYGCARPIARFDALEELVCCIMSQHTADANSFPAFIRLRSTFPNWADIEAAGSERVADCIRKAGLANQKGKNIVGCLKAIRERFGIYTLEPLRDMGPLEARKWLMALPGVGPKTASLVLCFNFEMPVFPVDTHVYRVSWRLGLIPKDLGEAKAHDALLALVPGDLAHRFHMALIQHGRMVCRAPVPDCGACILAAECPSAGSLSSARKAVAV